MIIKTKGTLCGRCGNGGLLINGILSFLPEEKNHWQSFFKWRFDSAFNETQAIGYAYKRNFDLVQAAVKKMIGEPEGKRILDVGCGNGLMNGRLSKHNQVVGVDFLVEMLEGARSRGFIPIHANSFCLPLKRETFDMIVAIELIQSIRNATELLSYLTGFLKESGRIIISGPNKYSFLRKVRRSIRKLSGKASGRPSPILWDPLFLANFLSEKGFTLEIGYNFFPFSRFVVEPMHKARRHPMAGNFFISASREGE